MLGKPGVYLVPGGIHFGQFFIGLLSQVVGNYVRMRDPGLELFALLDLLKAGAWSEPEYQKQRREIGVVLVLIHSKFGP